MKVSVICVADRPERLPLLAWSLAAQSHPDWELVVLDQTEQRQAVRYLEDLPLGPLTDRVTVMRVPRQGDWGQTEKEAAARSPRVTGDVLMFPADDAYYVPIALERLVRALEHGADLALCGWVYDLMGYRPMPPTPAIGHVDVGGFAVRRSTFLAHGWPSKGQTGDGELVVSLASTPGVRVALVPETLYVKN